MNANNLANLYKERAESYTKRVIELLSKLDFDNEFKQETDDYEQNLKKSGLDMESAYGAYIDKCSDLADEYSLLSDGIYGTVLVSLYHLWEKDCKMLCARLILYRNSVSEKKAKTTGDISNFKFVDIRDFLGTFQVSPETFNEIETLSLVANVIKHGKGHSSRLLLEKAPDLHSKLLDVSDLYEEGQEIEINMDRLGIEEVKHFVSALTQFWNSLVGNRRFYEMHF